MWNQKNGLMLFPFLSVLLADSSVFAGSVTRGREGFFDLTLRSPVKGSIEALASLVLFFGSPVTGSIEYDSVLRKSANGLMLFPGSTARPAADRCPGFLGLPVSGSMDMPCLRSLLRGVALSIIRSRVWEAGGAAGRRGSVRFVEVMGFGFAAVPFGEIVARRIV